jgi:hypothetical protein
MTDEHLVFIHLLQIVLAQWHVERVQLVRQIDVQAESIVKDDHQTKQENHQFH